MSSEETAVPGPDEAEIRDAIRTGIQDTTWVYDEHQEKLERLVDAIVGRLVQWDIVDLTGRVVVDLPEPGEQRDATVAWHPGNPLNYGASVVAYADSMGSWVDVVQVEGEIHTKPRVARLIAAALLAAADAAERLSVPGSSGEVQGG